MATRTTAPHPRSTGPAAPRVPRAWAAPALLVLVTVLVWTWIVTSAR